MDCVAEADAAGEAEEPVAGGIELPAEPGSFSPTVEAVGCDAGVPWSAEAAVAPWACTTIGKVNAKRARERTRNTERKEAFSTFRRLLLRLGCDFIMTSIVDSAAKASRGSRAACALMKIEPEKAIWKASQLCFREAEQTRRSQVGSEFRSNEFRRTSNSLLRMPFSLSSKATMFPV